MNGQQPPTAVECYDGRMSPSPLRVCSFESRRRDEMARLIEKQGGVPTLAPAMREVPLEDNLAAYDFADRLLAGRD